MIPKEAFIALSLIMFIGWVFGIVCDKLFNAWHKGHSEVTDDGLDHERWEDDPEPTNTCKWEAKK